MFRVAAVILVLFLSGCSGTTLHPIAKRLDPEHQAIMDRGWDHILADPSHPDRVLVLDALVKTELHHMGNDRFWFRAEKRFERGWIVMSSYFERTNPCADHSEVEILDGNRLLLSRLSYTGDEVRKSVSDMAKSLPFQPRDDRPLTPAEEAELERIEARQKRVDSYFRNLDAED